MRARRPAMTFESSDPRCVRSRERLSPYANAILERTGEHALHLNADVVTPEHLLSTLMTDPDCAAFALVLHAFADPPTIAAEALAMSPGVMVVASDSTLPFSPLGLKALLAARDSAIERSEGEVDDRHLLLSSVEQMDAGLCETLSAAGFQSEPVRALGATPASVPVSRTGPLFKHFSLHAKRSLSHANHFAAALKLDAIGPAHIFLGCLKESERMAELSGLSFPRARLLLTGRTADATRPTPRPIPPDESLVEFLEALPRGAGTLAMMAQYLAGHTPELAQILTRNKIGLELLERARTSFTDPPG
jgi:ATP-dependent Clp protease ATP-binding subunit ClpA